MSADIKIVVTGLAEMRQIFQKLSKSAIPYSTVNQLENSLHAAYMTTQARVHVITGKLKASGSTRSDYDGSSWSGEISYDKFPGIYELDRKNQPTYNHPEGQHASFLELDFEKEFMQKIIDGAFEAAFNGKGVG